VIIAAITYLKTIRGCSYDAKADKLNISVKEDPRVDGEGA